MTSEKRSILHFMGMVILYGLPPVLLLVALYAAFDPYGAVRKQTDFSSSEWEYNRGMVCVRSYKRALQQGRPPDSFILGSSLAIYYPAEAWAEKLPPGARIFHFDTSSQTIATLRRSIEYLDRSGADIDNALIILPVQVFGWEHKDGAPYIDPAEFHPELPAAKLEFQYRFLSEFFDRGFLRGYIPYLITGKAPSWESKLPLKKMRFCTDTLTNEEIYASVDSIIDRDGEKFYKSHGMEFDTSDIPHPLPRTISQKDIEHLIAIRDILRRHHTDYRVIIGPNRNTETLHPADEAVMRRIFGRRYFNFVVPMRHLGSQRTTYYDGFHYRPFVARQILDSVYRALPSRQ